MTISKSRLGLLLALLATLTLTACEDSANIPIDVVEDESIPAAPTNLVGTANADSVNLSWDEVSNASSYKVYRDNSLLVPVSNNSFSESGLADGTYLYKVAAVSTSGESSATASVSITIDSSAPDAPSALTATVDGASVSLSWDPASNASSYKVYRDGDFLSSTSNNSFSDSKLADGTYLYEVASVNISGESTSRASVSATIDTAPPDTPTGLSATVNGASVELSWDAASDATSYNVYRGGSLLSSVSSNSYTDSGLADGTYLYEIAAVNVNGESTSKASVSATIDTAPPDTPTGLSATVNGDSVELSWDAASDATSYNVYRGGSLLSSVSSNSYTDSGLADGTYLYEIAAVNVNGESTSKASVSATIDTAPPDTPTGLSATVNGVSVELNWNAVSDATSYNVYRDGSLLGSVSSNSFTDSGLADGTYLYEVTAVNVNGESGSKASVSATIDTAPPDTPTGLSATVNGDSVELAWGTASDAASYKVYRGGSLLSSVSSNSYTDSGLADGTYLYEVTAVNVNGESTSKASVSATVYTALPNTLTNLTATVSGDSVELNWDAASDADSYNVYRDGSLLSSVSGNSFTDSGLADGTYLYEVTAVNVNGESASKASVSATVYTALPNTPTNLTATVSGDSVALSWDAVSDATSYNVYRGGGLLSSVSSNSFTDSGLADGTYLYEVTAVNVNGESTSKASVSATVYTALPNTPTNLTATVSGDSVALSWDTASDATSYNVYRDGSFLSSVSGNSFSDSGLADATYLYEVTSVSDNGESTSKASVSATIDTAPPNAPTGLSATVNGDSVTLTWEAVSDATSYNVYRDGSFLSSVSSNSFSDSGLADATYLYEVTALDTAGESASKTSVSATVNNLPPNAPTGLAAMVNGDYVILNWDAVEDATSYNVYRDASLLGSVSSNSFIDSSLADGTYLYEVSALDTAGESASRASISATVVIDPLYTYQWHLKNTGQDAFATLGGNSGEDINHSGALALGVNGQGVRINVIDTGLEIQHPDLQANIVAGGSYNYVDGGTDPTNNTDSDGDHGTSVAGLIAAVGNNGVGISGVAGSAELQGYNYLGASNTTYSDYIFAHGGDDDLENTDIFNKSLGSSPTSDSRIYSSLLDALSCFTTGGSTDMSSTTAANDCGSALRSDLGAIYVKSAGNNFSDDGAQMCDSLGLTCWNVNMEAEETYPYQIIVGALNAKGEKSSYSSAGSAIWISAPGGEYGWDHEYWDSELDPYGYAYNTSNPESTLWQPALITIDQVGCARGYTTGRYDFNINGVPAIGYTSFHEDDTLNPNCEYTSTFNGTSSAAPVASGAVALMLDANSSLSWRDVKHILASSARQVDSGAAALTAENVVCTDSSCSSVVLSDSLSFVVRDAWITNAAGYKYHNWYGFGAVNAGAAVAMAQDYVSPLGTWQKKSYQSSPALAIPDSTGASASINIAVADTLTVEAVQLDLDITHSCIFELTVVLHSPSGTRSVLLTPYNQFNCHQNFSSTLLSNAFYGESAVGDWTVEIYDIWETNTGSLDSVSLNIYGH